MTGPQNCLATAVPQPAYVRLRAPTLLRGPCWPAENSGSKRSSLEQQADISAATKRQRTADGKADADHLGDQEGAAAEVKPEVKQEAREANTVPPEGGAVREDESAKLDPAAFWSTLEAKGEAKGEARSDTQPNAADVSNSVSFLIVLGACWICTESLRTARGGQPGLACPVGDHEQQAAPVIMPTLRWPH